MKISRSFFGMTEDEPAANEMKMSQSWRSASSNEIAAKVKELVADQHGIGLIEIADELDFFKDLDDSLDFMELLMRCEEEFGLDIPDEDEAVGHIRTVGDLTAYILKRLGV